MTPPALNAVARFVHRLSDGDHTDAELLSRFLRHGDERAYGEVVRRHGPMILALCRRVLRRHHDAEDAWQATFLVLARKAATIRQDQSLGAWLFQVAYRLALRARATETRRRTLPLTDATPEPVGRDPDASLELRPILDEELARLPERYRSALVLCYLEGHSQREAARLLTTTADAVNSRLKRARELLRRRLERRGLVASAGVLCAAWCPATADALSPSLVNTTIKAAGQFTLNLAECCATPRAAALARGAISTMTPVQKLLAGFALLIGCLIAGAGGLGPAPDRTNSPPANTDAAPAIAPAAIAEAGEPKKEPGEKPTPGAKAEARRHCIILWLGGGPSQLDTFDPKPGQVNGGQFKAIPTATKGISISEHLPKLAKVTNHMAILRTVSHREGDHGRATFLMRTGRVADGMTKFPPLPAVLAKELGDEASGLPGWVCVAPQDFIAPEAYGPGFLGAKFGPLITGEGEKAAPVLPGLAAIRGIAGENAEKMREALAKPFDLDEEKADVRGAYGHNRFGQGCLLARRLIERGVPVVEVTLPGWDTHADNFGLVARLSDKLDAGFATLVKDLHDRKLLDRTLIVCMGEFGRTPGINANNGRDHWPHSFCVVLAGGGIAGGKVIGETNADGVGVKDRDVSPPELFATIYRAVGVDPTKEYRSNLDAKLLLVDKGTEVVKEALK